MIDFFKWMAAEPFYTTMLAMLTGAIGVIVGHWLSLGRERRKEFNEVAGRVRAGLIEQHRVVDADLAVFENALGPRKAKAFQAAYSAFRDEDDNRKSDPFFMMGVHADPAAFKRANQRVLSFTRLRR